MGGWINKHSPIHHYQTQQTAPNLVMSIRLQRTVGPCSSSIGRYNRPFRLRKLPYCSPKLLTKEIPSNPEAPLSVSFHGEKVFWSCPCGRAARPRAPSDRSLTAKVCFWLFFLWHIIFTCTVDLWGKQINRVVISKCQDDNNAASRNTFLLSWRSLNQLRGGIYWRFLVNSAGHSHNILPLHLLN